MRGLLGEARYSNNRRINPGFKRLKNVYVRCAVSVVDVAIVVGVVGVVVVGVVDVVVVRKKGLIPWRGSSLTAIEKNNNNGKPSRAHARPIFSEYGMTLALGIIGNSLMASSK